MTVMVKNLTTNASHLINLHLMLFSRVSASLMSVTDLSLHRRSAGAPARGHILERKLVESTYSPHMQASPPTTREYCSAVPEGGEVDTIRGMVLYFFTQSNKFC